MLRIDCVSVQVKRLQFIMNRKMNPLLLLIKHTHTHTRPQHGWKLVLHMCVRHFYGNMSFWGFSFLFVCKWALRTNAFLLHRCYVHCVQHCSYDQLSVNLYGLSSRDIFFPLCVFAIDRHAFVHHFSFLFKDETIKMVCLNNNERKKTHTESHFFLYAKSFLLNLIWKFHSLSFDLI